MKKILRRILRLSSAPERAYDERAYWNQRQDPNAKEGWEEAHLNQTIAFIRKHTAGAKTVLEIGPGVGRTLPAHTPDRKITGLDISSLYMERLLDRAKELGLSMTLDIAEEGASNFPYETDSFDVGVSCQVFLHQRPDHIVSMMQEMSRVCGKVVVVTGGYRYGSESAGHVFGHDYPAIAANIGCELNNVQAFPPHIFFTYSQVDQD